MSSCTCIPRVSGVKVALSTFNRGGQGSSPWGPTITTFLRAFRRDSSGKAKCILLLLFLALKGWHLVSCPIQIPCCLDQGDESEGREVNCYIRIVDSIHRVHLQVSACSRCDAD